MAHENLKIKKQKKYNPFVSQTVERKTVGKVKCYLKVVKPNTRDVFGTTKAAGFWYDAEGRNVASSYPQAEQYDPTKIYFYEVGANDGSSQPHIMTKNPMNGIKWQDKNTRLNKKPRLITSVFLCNIFICALHFYSDWCIISTE